MVGTRYQCAICNKIRVIVLDPEDHAKKVKASPNGLVSYADIHRCEDGILGINDCSIDHNRHIRGFENLQLPKKRKPLKSVLPGLPTVKKSGASKGPKTYYINRIFPDKIVRVRIIDIRLETIIVIGKMDPRREKMVAFINSDQGTIELEYYASDITLNASLERWLTVMVQMLEKLPPTTLGLFIETLYFIFGNYFNFPSVFLILQLQTLITAHETFFRLKVERDDIQEKINYISAKYGEEVSSVMNDMVVYLASNPKVPLRHFTVGSNHDLPYLINLFLILEQENVLSIERPGVINEKGAIDLAVDK